MENTESLCEVTTSASCRADIINELLAQLDNKQDSDHRAEIRRKLGEYPDTQVIKTLWDLRNNLENESDDFVQYEIKLSLHKVTTHPSINIDFFLDNLEVFQSQDNNSQAPKVLIDADLIEEFLLRNQTTLNREATRVMGLVLEGKINPYIGEIGLIKIWHNIKNLKSQEYANRSIIELLSKINVGQVNLKEIDLEKYPNVNLKTAIQVEIARKYGLAGIITIRDREFIASGYPFVGSPSLFLQFLGEDTSPASIERTLKNLGKAAMEHEKVKLNQLLENEPQQNLFFEDNLVLFQGWKIENFEILCANNNLTSATVILCNTKTQERYTESAFKKGSVDALCTAFDEALAHLVEIKHHLKSIYVANLTPGKQGATTVKAVVEYDGKEVITIHTHENILKAYFFAYVKAMIAVYAPDEYHPDIHSTKELTYLHKIGERDFRGLNFSQVNLMDGEANLSDAKLMGCNFSKANLSGVNLTNADLTGADLSHANLTDVKLDENNLTLLDGTILTNTIMPEIRMEIIGESRLEKVAQLLKHIDPQSESRILAIHSMTDSIWWDNPLGQKFWEVNEELIKREISIQRVFILPEVPTQKHLQVIQEQLNSGIKVACICQEKAKDVEGYCWDNTNLLISENLSVPRNSFTARRIMNGQTESGYISYQTRVVETDKSLFNALWEKSEKLSTEANLQEQLANLNT
ncbi:MAG: pentapeptide repeat-containing protein [Microcystis sp. M038S2]|uniref:pentapeptide repeat-containing protein n=1 Tax=unclassified Microcystis TaxID=2643300 RepID=UPI00258FC53B|nr:MULTISPECIES: pentapeptide repeat-containing protein [unclassified Microcystis]MCA2686448.1 pentapeptide repeat-containing protein [Microcystis sp. M046S2]MCA2706466.1 pentapeptide repeat-containing protein [Microcystis sp. M038S2]MCA2945894.1 pentapeptide repeat-containing protein [Microcystis sp. M109S1]MCA2953995.1 pentapeptide repeat-containing protein [Microcystis sp. M112S1]